MLDDLSLHELENLLTDASYISEPPISMALYLSLKLNKPLLVEGPAGVGKTEIAKVLSRVLETDLVRLQCYDGIEASQALYEWNYQYQLMYLKMQEIKGIKDSDNLETELYDQRFLLRRPILSSILAEKTVVLLIDEIDRADEAFESFLLEVLSDWQVSVPEIGTLIAKTRPVVVLTSNAARELSEALRRRCMFLYIDYPSFAKEVAIVTAKIPGLHKRLVQQICKFMEALREKRLRKLPGVAETLDWARALAALHIEDLDREMVASTLGLVLKDWKDQREIQLSLSQLLEKTGVQSKI
ncbi:MAG: MoxR family ATPase [Saprospiraceae bacterium]|nr:MoxR family ATPase [Saprospiraceae bacterium]